MSGPDDASRDPRYLKMSNASPERQRQRLATKVTVDVLGCWVWQGNKTWGGYGVMRTGPGVKDYTHRVSYRLNKGPIPEGLEIDHLCRNRLCVNPEHLEAVPTRINFLRGEHPHARAHRTGTCRKGHPMVGANVMTNAKTGARRCRRCNYEWQDARRRARRAQARP